jgi:hypothetical protein
VEGVIRRVVTGKQYLDFPGNWTSQAPHWRTDSDFFRVSVSIFMWCGAAGTLRKADCGTLPEDKETSRREVEADPMKGDDQFVETILPLV